MIDHTPTPLVDDPTAVTDDRHTVSSWPRHLPAILGITLILALLGVGYLQGQGDNGTQLPAAGGPQRGQTAPDFALTAFDGRALRLAAFRGHPVVLNFWASWCAPCRQEAPALAAAFRAKGDHIMFLGIDVRDREADARRFIAEFDLRYPSAPDNAGVEQRYGIVGIPTTVFIRADGTVVRTWLGPLDEQKLIAFTEELD